MKTIVYKRVTQLFVVLFLLVTGTEVKAQYPYDFSFAGIPYDSCYNLWDYNIFKVDCMNFNSGYYRYDRYSSSSMEWQTVVELVEMKIPSICIDNID